MNMDNSYTPSSVGNTRTALLDKEIVVLPTWIQMRVSTRPQVGRSVRRNGKTQFEEKASPKEQRKRCREAIADYKGNCPTCYKEIRLTLAGESFGKGESGRKEGREDTSEILSAAEKGLFKIIVTIDNDRLARDRGVATWLRSRLKKMGIQFYSLAQPLPIKCPGCFDPLDDDSAVIIETLSDMKSQLDLSKIRRNYKIGMPHRIEDGKPAGPLAYGLVKTYKHIGVDARGSEELKEVYKWSEEKTNIVKRITREFLAGGGTWKISQGLNLDDIPSPQGKKWGRSAINHILRNPVYAGKVRFGWKTCKGGKRTIQPREKWMLRKAAFKGIWSWPYYEKIQKEIKRRRGTGGRALSSDALLIGLLKCGYCCYSMYQGKSSKRLKNGDLSWWKGYVCGTFKHRGVCRHNGVKQDMLDGYVLREVLKLADERTRNAFRKKFEETERQDIEGLLKQKESALKKHVRKLDRATEAYMKEIDSLEEYARNKSQLLPVIEQLKGEVAGLKARRKKPAVLSWRKVYENALQRFLECPTPEDKKKVKVILSRLIERVEFKKKPLSIKIFYKLS